MPKNRSLAEIDDLLVEDSAVLETTLSELLTRRSPLNVLEVGFGHGRALMELAWKFHSAPIGFYGINKKPGRGMRRREDLLDTARQYHIASDHELARFTLPDVLFYDATRLHFEDSSLDLIYSAVSIRFVEDKATFLEEVARVLKPGGIALLDFSELPWDHPHTLTHDDTLLTPALSHFVLVYGDELIPFLQYLKLREGEMFEFRFLRKDRFILQVQKLRPGRLDLRLSTNTRLSCPMRDLSERYKDMLGKEKGGFRSVYDVHPDMYRALGERGLLSQEQLCAALEMGTGSLLKGDRHAEGACPPACLMTRAMNTGDRC